jgi:adhesin transport system outer membrane protein
MVAGALDHSARLDEAEAGIVQAQAARREARSGYYPTLDASVTAQKSIVRNFSNDPEVIVDKSRASSRVDATLSARQTLFDFGATDNRIAGAAARFTGAGSNAAAEADEIALDAITAWYDVVTYGALTRLAESFVESQATLREAVRQRVELGQSAQGDLPRVESYIAAAKADLARYRRLETSAETHFAELYGVPAPSDLARAPGPAAPELVVETRESAVALVDSVPSVETAEATALAARKDARAERANTYPRISAGVDAGRYGPLGERNYDVRGLVTVSQRLFGGVDARADQAEARAAAADAHARRVRDEAERAAAIAWSDVRSLEQLRSAQEESYIASRQSRDVLAERFRVARGTLFDLLEAESSYFQVAAAYVQAVTELDTARYVLLSRTGRLLAALGIASPGKGRP